MSRRSKCIMCMNRLCFTILALFLMCMTFLSRANAGAAVKEAKITEGISPRRVLVPGAINRSYNWEFENQEYTILIAFDRKEYNKARSTPRAEPRNPEDYLRYARQFVRDGTDALEDLVRAFHRVMRQRWNAERRANFVLAFVQELPYRFDIEATGYDDYPKTAIETLVEGGGDCEDTSILCASILHGLELEVALIWLPPVPATRATVAHLVIGVNGNFKGDFYSYDNTNYYYCETTYKSKLGGMPKKYGNIKARVLPIGVQSSSPKPLPPNVTFPKPTPPRSLSPQERLAKGIKFYEKARFNEAIRILRSALNGLGDREHKIQAYLYLGCSKWGFEPLEESVISEFGNALRQDPNLRLPPRIGEDHPVFRPILEKTQEKVAGKLTITVSPPKALIWVDGNLVEKKNPGTGSTWLLKGTHTVKGSFGRYSKTATVRMNPGDNEKLHLKILPVVNHDAPASVFVKHIPRLTLAVVSTNIPKQVEVHYTLHDLRGKMIKRSSKEMTLEKNQSNSYTWRYGVELPPPAHAGQIKYLIEADESRIPEQGFNEVRVHQPVPPGISFLQPDEGAILPDSQSIFIEVEVKSSMSVNGVRVHYDASRERLSENSPFQILYDHFSPGKYREEIPTRDNAKEQIIWYFVTAIDASGGETKSEARKVIVVPPPEIYILQPDDSAVLPGNQAITIEAKVTSKAIPSVSIAKVRAHYDSSRDGLSENSPFRILSEDSSSVNYRGGIPAGDDDKERIIWYFVKATNTLGGVAASEVRSVKIMPPPEISIVKPERSATIPPDVPVTIEANVTSRVTSSEPMIEVRVHYESSRDRLSESSPFRILSEDSPLGKYRGIIPTDDNEKEQTIWYFVKVTDALGGEAASEIRMVRVRKPLGIWTSHSWSNYISKNGSINSDSERGNVFSIAYLSEGKDSQTLGAQLDFAYEHPENTSAIVQWGPRLKESSVSFALRGGIAGYRHFDSGSPRATYSNQFTPILGCSLRLYPLDGVVVDVTGLMRLRSSSSAGDEESSIIKDYLHHYGMGIRLYMNRTLNFTAGYGRWRASEHENASVQIGLGITF